ncbi:hypothetical protein GCM10023199_42330 [Actinomycetospora chibensis]
MEQRSRVVVTAPVGVLVQDSGTALHDHADLGAGGPYLLAADRRLRARGKVVLMVCDRWRSAGLGHRVSGWPGLRWARARMLMGPHDVVHEDEPQCYDHESEAAGPAGQHLPRHRARAVPRAAVPADHAADDTEGDSHAEGAPAPGRRRG